ncbi:hypothetical protein PI125_g8346 [Phytophthora idaei]|nr:hypothetical protein PI125_g8346 [Phytophthora idaei]
MERMLQRVEAVEQDGDYDTLSPKSRDAKANGARFNRAPLRSLEQGDLACMTTEDDSDSEEKRIQPSYSDTALRF